MINDVEAEAYPRLGASGPAQHGIGSVLALPLRMDGEMFGALAIAAPETDAFEEREKQVLMEAADDLAFGLRGVAHAAAGGGRPRKRSFGSIARCASRAAVNHALTHASDEASLLKEICRVAVDDCGYRGVGRLSRAR